MKTHVNKFCNFVHAEYVNRDKWTEPLNIEELFYYLGIDITTDLVCGKTIKILEFNDFSFVHPPCTKALGEPPCVCKRLGFLTPKVGHWLDYDT